MTHGKSRERCKQQAGNRELVMMSCCRKVKLADSLLECLQNPCSGDDMLSGMAKYGGASTLACMSSNQAEFFAGSTVDYHRL